MAKNRKVESGAIRFGPAVKAVLLCLLIGGSGVGYVWQKNQIQELNRQYKMQEKRLTDLQLQNQRLNQQKAELSSQATLEKKIVEFKLGLSQPSPGRILRLAEPVASVAVEDSPAAVRPLAGR
ncbi:MAG: hypothetical protein H7Y43_02620 [Akkermansiaceae bacterium]|nr:hypothetical protein [Verrucomicrobiales bacterium]